MGLASGRGRAGRGFLETEQAAKKIHHGRNEQDDGKSDDGDENLEDGEEAEGDSPIVSYENNTTCEGGHSIFDTTTKWVRGTGCRRGRLDTRGRRPLRPRWSAPEHRWLGLSLKGR